MRAAIRPPRANAAAQQRAFDAFRREYNTDAPTSTWVGRRRLRITRRRPMLIRSSSRPKNTPGTSW